MSSGVFNVIHLHINFLICFFSDPCQPTLTDAEYDALEDELLALDPHHRHFQLVCSMISISTT